MAENDHHVDEVLRRSRAIRDETGALIGELRQAADDLHRALDLKGRMERHPWATMAAAVGVGYVLGGGLFSRFTGTLMRVGARAVLIPIVKSQIEAFAQGVEMGRAAPVGYAGSEGL